MMLGEMQAVEARLVGGLDEGQPLVEQLRESGGRRARCGRTVQLSFLVQPSDFLDHGNEPLGVGLDELGELRLIHVGRRAAGLLEDRRDLPGPP